MSRFFETYEQRKARLAGEAPKRCGSRMTIPQHCHPAAKIVFEEMRLQGATYYEIEDRSSVLRTTLKSWRGKNVPTLTSLEAVLSSLGHVYVVVPSIETMDSELREDIEALAAKHGTKVERLAAWLVEVKALSTPLSAEGAARVAVWRERAEAEAELRRVATAERDARVAARKADVREMEPAA